MIAKLLVGLIVVIAGLSVVVLVQDSRASHTYTRGPQDNCAAKDCLWSNLEPSGNRIVKYWTCETAPPSTWGDGVENWDALLPTWVFDPDGINQCNAMTVMRWEVIGSIECPVASFIACWASTNYSVGSGVDHNHLLKARILFDQTLFPPYGSAREKAISGHEWGHNLGLTDHLSASECAAGTIMGFVGPESNPCHQVPPPHDVASVECNVYARCGDFNGGGCTDALVREGTDLKIVRGNCSGTFSDSTAQPIGGGWGGFSYLLRPGDFNGNNEPNANGEACTDVIAVENTAPFRARLFRGNCGQAGQYFKDTCCGTEIGSGWDIFNSMFAPGDFSGDSCADVLVRQGGDLKLIRGNCHGQFLDQQALPIGTGWGGFTWFLGPGDWNSDGCADVIVRDGSSLKLYRGNCGLNGQYFKDNGVIMGGGVNWSSSNYPWLIAPGDFSGDGCMDVISKDSAGTPRLHRGNCGSGFTGSPSGLGGGWNIFNYIF